MDKKLLKTNFPFQEHNINTIEMAAFKATLLGFNILSTKYDEENLNAIKKGIKNANKKLIELKAEIQKTHISIDLEFNNENLDQIYRRIKKLYSKKDNFEILNISFLNQDFFSIDNLINKLSKIENPLIYIINLNRKNLSNSSI